MSVDFSHGYSPPGVYIEEDPAPLATNTGIPPVRVAIIGRSAGHQSHVEQVTLSATAVRLSKEGVISGSISVKLISDGSDVADDQYDLTVVQGQTEDANDFWSDIALADGATLTEGTAVWFTYDYVVPTFFDPKVFSNFEDIKDAYGAPLNLTPQALGDSTYQAVNSPLTLAAQCAIANGVGEMVLLALNVAADASSGTIKTALAAAYPKIATDYSVSIVVPLTDGIVDANTSGVALDLFNHVSNVSDDGYLRTGFIGFETSTTTAPDSLIAGGAFASKRILFAYANPSGMQLFNGNANQTVVVGHQYLAAAYGGLATSLPVQKALTHEAIAGFSGIAGTPLSNAIKNQYAAAGVALTEINRQGQMVVRHGTTTDRTNISTAELSVVRSRDSMVSTLQSGVEGSGLIGTPIDVNTPLSVKSVVAGLLENCVASSVIVDYTELQVRQASTDPSVIEVKFLYRPAFPLNYILISFSIDVSTGDTTLAA